MPVGVRVALGDGEADAGPYRAQLLAHVRRTVQDKLQISDPDWLRRSQETPDRGD